MDAINILIFDNDSVHAAGLQSQLKEMGYNIQDTVDNPGEAIAAFYASEPDLVIINIDINRNSGGFELAKNISEDRINAKPVIFISGDKSDSIFESAKKFQPCAYFIKPFDKYLIRYAVELALNNIPHTLKQTQQAAAEGGILSSDSLFIRKTKKIVKVPLNEVQYIEVESKYSTLYTNIGKFLLRISLVELMEKLPQQMFIRVHRNYIVNLNSIVEFDYDECIVRLKIGSVPMGRSFKNTIAEQFLLLS